MWGFVPFVVSCVQDVYQLFFFFLPCSFFFFFFCFLFLSLEGIFLEEKQGQLGQEGMEAPYGAYQQALPFLIACCLPGPLPFARSG